MKFTLCCWSASGWLANQSGVHESFKRIAEENKYKAKCKLLFDDKIHEEKYIHPPFCKYKGLCTLNFSKTHEEDFIHPRICKFEAKCTNNQMEHLKDNLHIKSVCDANCLLSTNPKEWHHHLKFFGHFFKPICRQEPNCLKKNDKEHSNEFSHFCSFGSDCKKLGGFGSNSDHIRNFVHINKKFCEEDLKVSNRKKKKLILIFFRFFFFHFFQS